MKMTQPEIIQVLRRRKGLSQGDFGARAFDTSFESGRTKVKRIELGKQIPTRDDLKKMAGIFGVDMEMLTPADAAPSPETGSPAQGPALSPQCMERFPGLGPYVDMLNKSVLIGDEELIAYLCEKISDLLNATCSQKAVNQ